MLKLLLVDDEYLELTMLIENIDWATLGFVIIGSAKNGQDALEKISKNLPDVVITDIKMPIMDGVLLAKTLYNAYPHIKVVFLSGYNQYEYMREALEVQALDYLLKPLDLDEIPPLMEKIKHRCKEDLGRKKRELSSAIQTVCSTVLLGNPPINRTEFATQCCLCTKTVTFTDTFYMAVGVLGEYSYWKDNEKEGREIISRCRQYLLAFAKEYNAEALPIQEHAYLLLSTSPILPPPRDWTEDDRGLWAIICCKKTAITASDIPHAYAHLDRLRHWWVTHCPTKPFLYEDEMEQKAGQLLPLQRLPALDTYLLLNYLKEEKQEQTNTWVFEYYEQLNEEGSNILTVNLFDFLYESLIVPSKRLQDLMPSKADVYEKLFKIESTNVLIGEVCHYLTQLIENLKIFKSDPTEMIMAHVRDFIELNYSHPLSIDILAENFYFSPNYLRSIFKKHTGITVLEYITEVRLQKAENLVRTTPLTVSRISSKVGYSNPSYFCVLFSRKYGVTPNEYRNRTR